MGTYRRRSVWTLALTATLGVAGAARAADAPYPTMAPVADYMIADRAAEIALARTAAPPSVSDAAEVLVLGPKGYVSAAKGTNGFVCIVLRGWFSGLKAKEFWNPRVRGPICFNRQAARTVLPTFLTRTAWAMSGVSLAEISRRTQADMKAGRIPRPATGAMTYMLSKQGYLSSVHTAWHPHIMFFMPPMPTADWGADLPGAHIFSTAAGGDPYTMFYIPVGTWSDGTPDESAGMKHSM